MKKIFWTSIVWILLFCGAIAYVKWFNQPVADMVASFIDPSFTCPVCELEEVECDCPDCQECEACEVVEPAVCNCPAEIAVDDSENWSNVFSKLDRIESLVRSVSNWEEIESISDEQLFEEFKARREANQ